MTQEQRQKIRSAIIVGAAGGLFWSFVNYVLHYLNFTLLGPSIFIQPFAPNFGHRPLAHIVGMGIASVLGIVFALLYVFLLSKFYHPLIGVGCGLVLFGLVYYVLNPILSLTNKPIHQMGVNTFVTEICLFALFGMFVGFSLSAEYSDKEKSAKAK